MRTKLVHEIKQGMLVVRIRRTKSTVGGQHVLSIHRRYRNGALWQESTRLGRDDIPFIRFLLDEAHTWIIEQDCGENSKKEGES
jgi:hypothetical protein